MRSINQELRDEGIAGKFKSAAVPNIYVFDSVADFNANEKAIWPTGIAQFMLIPYNTIGRSAGASYVCMHSVGSSLLVFRHGIYSPKHYDIKILPVRNDNPNALLSDKPSGLNPLPVYFEDSLEQRELDQADRRHIGTESPISNVICMYFPLNGFARLYGMDHEIALDAPSPSEVLESILGAAGDMIMHK